MEVVYLSAGGGKYTKRGTTWPTTLLNGFLEVSLLPLQGRKYHQEDLEQAG